jgi:hypothetical protein
VGGGRIQAQGVSARHFLHWEGVGRKRNSGTQGTYN